MGFAIAVLGHRVGPVVSELAEGWWHETLSDDEQRGSCDEEENRQTHHLVRELPELQTGLPWFDSSLSTSAQQLALTSCCEEDAVEEWGTQTTKYVYRSTNSFDAVLWGSGGSLSLGEP